MNKTANGRWGRYQTIKGVLHKKCNGALHPEGEWMPLSSYFILKKGPRKGKPISRCQACERISKGRDPESGLIPVDRVWFVFRELEQRIGKAETCRLLGVSHNLWMRAERRIYKRMYRKTAKAAMVLLRELRAQDVSRHPKSIKSGAKQRGRIERKPPKKYTGVDPEARSKAQTKRWENPKERAKMDVNRATPNNDVFFTKRKIA